MIVVKITPPTSSNQCEGTKDTKGMLWQIPLSTNRKEVIKMAKPIKGNKEVDELALQKIQEACKYVEDNLKELSQEVLMGLLGSFDQTKIHINRVLDWRLKQGQGAKYVARIHTRLDELGVRLTTIEEKLDIPAPSEEDDEKEASQG